MTSDDLAFVEAERSELRSRAAHYMAQADAARKHADDLQEAHRQHVQALEAAELEIKGLEGELREQDRILAEMQEQLAPTRMGGPMIRNCSLTDNMRDDDAARWRWITRAGRTRELCIPAEENKVSIDAAIDGKRLMLPNA